MAYRRVAYRSVLGAVALIIAVPRIVLWHTAMSRTAMWRIALPRIAVCRVAMRRIAV